MERRVVLDGAAESAVLLSPEWKPLAPFSSGLLATFETVHKLSAVAMSKRRGDYLQVDSRGKVYHCSPSLNTFDVVKKATVSGPVCSAAFVESKSAVALLAYRSGSVLVFDMNAKRSIASVQTPSGLAAKIIRCHPTKSMAVIADEQNQLSVWDLRLMKSTLALSCQERIVDVQFIDGGSMLVLVLETSGLHIYRASDMRVVLRCPFPDSERKPKWTAFAFAPSTLPGSLRFLLTGDNSLLYLFETAVPFDISTDVFASEDDAPLVNLVGVVDLPVSIRGVAAMTVLGEASLQPQVLVLSDDGAICVVDAQGFGGGSIGIWTVLAELGGWVTCAASSTASKGGEVLAASPQNPAFLLQGTDGACRLFDASFFLGTGASVAAMLSSRGPYCSSARVPVYRVVEGRGQKVEVHKEGPDISVRNRAGISATETLAKKAAEKNRKEREIEARKRKESRERAKESREQAKEEERKKAALADKKERAKQRQEDLKKYSEAEDLGELQAISPPADRPDAAGPPPHAHSLHGAGLPLFEMAMSHISADKQLNEAKLRQYLASHQELPARYRQVVWRLLLKLPENAAAFADLARRGPHPSFDRLHDKYPIRSRRLYSRLHNTCSQLAHWSPIFGEVSYLPQLVFPFTIVFGVDELATLEVVMTILMWWGYSWHATYPQPPVHIVDSIDRVLHLADTKLYNHLSKCQAPPGVAGWAMVSSLFTEVLSRENWLRLMDHIFLNQSRTAALYVAPVAILIAMRSTLLQLDTPDEIMASVRSQHSLDFGFIIKLLNSLLTNTPSKVLSGAALRTRFDEDYGSAAGGGGGGGDLDEIDQARECLAMQGGHPVFPLPTGRYPAYDGFPKYQLDWQLRDRKAAMELGKDTGAEDENMLEQLQMRVEKVNDSHRDWLAQRSEAARLEEAARVSAASKEKAQLRELQRIEEDIARQRMAALSAAEKSAQEQMTALQELRTETEGMMRLSEEQMLERASLTLNLQRQRELAEAAEGSMQEKINSLHLRRSKEEWVKAVERSIEDREKELGARDRLLQEQQRRQEEEALLRREERRRRADFLKEEEALLQVHDDMTARMQKLLLTRETDAVDLERQRALRFAQEQADEAVEAAQRSQHLLQKQEAAALREAQLKADAAGAQRSHQGYADMLQVLRSDGERAAHEERSKVLLGRLGAERPGVAASAVALQEQMAARVEKDVLGQVTLSGAMQDRELSRMAAGAGAGGGASSTAKGYLSDESSIDNILAPLGEQVKREVLRGSQGPGEGQGEGEEASADDLNDSALWAYDDAPPLP